MDTTPSEDLVHLNAEEQNLLDQFIQDNQLFLGPDPEIMENHSFLPRTPKEQAILEGDIDPHLIHKVRGRLNAALLEGFDMVEQMGAAPGAKWGDLCAALFTASGDLSAIGPKGVVAFSAVCHYPVRFIHKYWMNEPTVGVKDGDGFIHNDSRYGNIHNTDQSMIMPMFHEGELICWVASTIHEGENGACEPGGMPPSAESKYDEGLKMPPFRIVENNRIKRDLLTFLQNSVRDPKLQLEDMKVKLHACLRIKERIRQTIEECGVESVIATLRKNMEDVDTEVRRRIGELPDGTVRVSTFIDSTLRENILMKINLAITVKGERMILDLRGTCPEFTNRAINTVLGSWKTGMATNFLTFVWPDLPHNMAAFSSIEVVTHKNSIADCSVEAPNAMSLISIFRALAIPSLVLAKMLYSLPTRWTNIIGSHYTQPATFIYGGQTQHGEITGNFCADINGNGQGARAVKDGEHALSPVFGFFCDTGEQELVEEELPMVRLIAQHITKDRVGFGKYRGGAGYEQVVTVKDTPGWGLMTGCTGSLHSSTVGLFGAYGCPAYPLVKVKNVNVFDALKNDPGKFSFDIVTLMNEQLLDGDYGSYDMGLTLEMVKEGEIYGICQGAGGGYGDVLDRDPELVMKDIAEDVISHVTAREIYHVVYDEDNLVVDEAATREARDREREARKRRGKPFKEFVSEWVTAEPPANIPYYGSWDDDEIIWAGMGESRETMNGNELRGTILPDPKDMKIHSLKREVAALKARLQQT